MPDIDCLLCGTCVADVLVRPVPLTVPIGGGRLLHAGPIEATTGGLVCNTGMAMRRLGATVAASSIVGEDDWGGLVRRQLTASGIESAGLETDPYAATSTTAVLIDPTGERSFAHHVGACAGIDADFIRRQAPQFRRARLAVVGYVGLLPGLEPVLGEAVAFIRAAGCRVALETGGAGGTLSQLAPALRSVDCYVPSLDEARHQTGVDDPRGIIACYRGHGAAGVVGVKLGAQGTLLSSPDGDVLEIPCVPAPGPVADTTGAGDAFLAGLLTGILREMPLRDAGLLGAATAACCVTGLGATKGLRSFEETMSLIRG